ncbi:MAG: class IV adenylate cyclase [Acidobacteriia bacterium]|nr:class IV adenylate cyclase [Terriglobia bacterium]
MRPNREIEIKLRVAGARAARSLLRTAGFHVRRRRVFEDNAILDTPDLALRSRGCLLRVRTAGAAATLTYKGPSSAGRYKSRQELEIAISAPGMAFSIFENLGFHRVFRYQKYRTEYSEASARGVVTLDETPVGCFLEIEGAPRWIDRTARKLGFRESDYIRVSYGVLYFQFCAERGIKPGDMVFPRSAT